MNRLKSVLFPLIGIFAGAITPLAFAPFSFWPVQFICLGVLLALILHADNLRCAFLSGWAFETASLSCGLYWLYVSMHTYGKLPSIMAATAVIGLSLFLGSICGFACLLTRYTMSRWSAGYVTTSVLVFPALWLFSEWIRGWIVTGLPWLTSGYAHTASPLSGFAPLLGVFGISFVSATISGALVSLFHLGSKNRRQILVLGIVLPFALLGSGKLLEKVEWTQPHGSPLDVRLLQGNIAQEFKFSPDQIITTLDIYADMISARRADLIVTPETAIPVYAHMLPAGYLENLNSFAKLSQSHLAIGMPIADSRTHYTNSLIVLSPDFASQADYRYNKHHLVPFGEFIPTGFRWFVNMMRIPLGDFTRGDPLQKSFRVKTQQVLPNICYEDIFGEEIAAQIRNEYRTGQPASSILLNVTNIAWFGNTIALPQHLQISQMRAMETGRPMLRATNTGTTAFIDPKGRIIHQLAPYTRGELAFSIQGTEGITPYIRFGNLLALLIAVVGIIAARVITIRCNK